MNKSTFESMLESNIRGELSGSMGSVEMREILQKGVELFEENEQLKAFIPKQGEIIVDAEQLRQLHAQNAEMREALSQFKYDYEQGESMSNNYHDVCELLRNEAIEAVEK
jgi:dephospho-CoA kinase